MLLYSVQLVLVGLLLLKDTSRKRRRYPPPFSRLGAGTTRIRPVAVLVRSRILSQSYNPWASILGVVGVTTQNFGVGSGRGSWGVYEIVGYYIVLDVLKAKFAYAISASSY